MLDWNTDPPTQIVKAGQLVLHGAGSKAVRRAIESHQPYLIVENLTVRPLNAFRGFKPAPGQEPEVNVQLDVGAWAYPEATKSAAPAKAS
jgi:hypothetical protein